MNLANFNLNEILTSFMVLFTVIDILGSIPLFIELKRKMGYIEAKKATIAATGILISFLFLGSSALKVLGIDMPSFAVAGSFVLFILALEMILGITITKDEAPSTASIVPIAFPIIAGAGSLTTVLSLRAANHTENIIVAILLNMVVVYLVLSNAGRIGKFLGKGILGVFKKVFGIVLLAISIKLFTKNIHLLLN